MNKLQKFIELESVIFEIMKMWLIY